MAQQQSVNTSDKPEVVIEEVNGDLRLMGWDRREVFAKADGNLTLTQDGDKVYMRCAGDMVLRVPEGASLNIDQLRGDARIKSVDGAVSINSAAGDLSLRRVGTARVQKSAGDVSVKHTNGELIINSVGGDLSITDAQEIKVDNVSGDLNASALQGQARIGNVSGDLNLQAVQGGVNVENASGSARLIAVQGDIVLGNISGDATVAGVQGKVAANNVAGDLNVEGANVVEATVGGDATLGFGPNAGQSVVTAGGDIKCRCAPDANVTLHLNSGSSSISVNVPGVNQSLEQHDYELKLGNGDAPVTLTAGGDVRVGGWEGWEGRSHGGPNFDFDFDFDFNAEDFGFNPGEFGKNWGAFGERVAERARQAAEHVAERARQQAEHVSAKAAEQAERAARKMEEQMRRAEEQMHRAEEHSRRAERRAQFMGRRYGPDVSWQPARAPMPPTPPEPPSEPVSDEERLTILRMLEQKKITVAQAEQLLAALSGKEK